MTNRDTIRAPALRQAADTKQDLLDQIAEATTTISRLEDETAKAHAYRARLLQDALTSGLTTPQERQHAAGISRETRRRLEARRLPPPSTSTTPTPDDQPALPYAAADTTRTNGDPRP